MQTTLNETTATSSGIVNSSGIATSSGIRSPETRRKSTKPYLSVTAKFVISHGFAALWMLFSISLSLPWLHDFSEVVTMPGAILIIAGIAYIPGYLNAFLVVGLLLDRQPPFHTEYPTDPVTVLVAARNEEHAIRDTLRYIASQDYTGYIKVFVIDNASSDETESVARSAGMEFGLNVEVLREEKPGKFNALNAALQVTDTPLVITLDADTLLHKSAIRYLVARIHSAPEDVCAVAGSVLVRNSRENLKTRIQEWDYFLGIASIKRLQGLYQGTLVAQGAYSIYKTENLIAVGGWPDAIGEDIVLTWKLLKHGWKIYFEPLAVAFTDVPTTWKAFAKQRSRWARGMIEALEEVKPWHQPQPYTKYLTAINLVMPYLDLSFTIFWLPGLVLALFGIHWIVGAMTLLVLPLTLVSYGILYLYQKHVFQHLNLKIRKNMIGFFLFVVGYQAIMSPVSVWGYIQEALKLKRKWK